MNCVIIRVCVVFIFELSGLGCDFKNYFGFYGFVVFFCWKLFFFIFFGGRVFEVFFLFSLLFFYIVGVVINKFKVKV